jgi:hypothetical protein
LRVAGFASVEIRPFFVPQTHALPSMFARTLQLLERSGLVARALLRYRFTYLCAASLTKR